ncbi:hypothetical protein HDG32_005344 [Paraburkholderia sp. CI2]|nr:hypothetical protein [Paraburkholderia sp. CI2]MBB5469197.1 hypothetical protein [Paraburkholderia sp. CI2]
METRAIQRMVRASNAEQMLRRRARDEFETLGAVLRRVDVLPFIRGTL